MQQLIDNTKKGTLVAITPCHCLSVVVGFCGVSQNLIFMAFFMVDVKVHCETGLFVFPLKGTGFFFEGAQFSCEPLRVFSICDYLGL